MVEKYYKVKDNKAGAGFRKGFVFAVYTEENGYFTSMTLTTDKVKADESLHRCNTYVEKLYYNPKQ